MKGRFIGNIPCSAHILNLAVNDIARKANILAPKREKNIENDEENDIATIEQASIVEKILPTLGSGSKPTRKRRNQPKKALEIAPKLSTYEKVRKIVTLLKYSHIQAAIFAKEITSHDISGQKRINLDSGIRWNSTFQMLQGFLHLRPAIEGTIRRDTDQIYTNLSLSEDE